MAFVGGGVVHLEKNHLLERARDIMGETTVNGLFNPFDSDCDKENISKTIVNKSFNFCDLNFDNKNTNIEKFDNKNTNVKNIIEISEDDNPKEIISVSYYEIKSFTKFVKFYYILNFIFCSIYLRIKKMMVGNLGTQKN